MRLTVSAVVCVLLTGLCIGLPGERVNAQIPEYPQFQSVTYARLPYNSSPQQSAATNISSAATDAVSEEDNDSWTEWEKKFSPQTLEPVVVQPVPEPVPYEVPYLTYVYNHRTGRFHITPYEPGYAANPAAFPKQTSPLHVWVSAKPAASQPNPQVPYMSYYDPDPVILPAEIRLRGSRFAVPLTNLQPVPLPVPKPPTAVPLSPPARTRIGGQIRQTFSPFAVL